MSDYLCKGYAIVSNGEFGRYRGIDRNSFEPVILEQDVDTLAFDTGTNLTVSNFISEEWRKEAGRNFEKNELNDYEDIYLIWVVY